MGKPNKGAVELTSALKDNPIAVSIMEATSTTELKAVYGQIEGYDKRNTLEIEQLKALFMRRRYDLHIAYNDSAKANGTPVETQSDIAKELNITQQWVSRCFKTITDTNALRAVLTGKKTLNGKDVKSGDFGRPGPKKGQKASTPYDRAKKAIDTVQKILVEDYPKKTSAMDRSKIIAYGRETLLSVFGVITTPETAQSEKQPEATA